MLSLTPSLILIRMTTMTDFRKKIKAAMKRKSNDALLHSQLKDFCDKNGLHYPGTEDTPELDALVHQFQDYQARIDRARQAIENEEEICYDVAAENGQIFDNVKHMKWFVEAVAEEL